jgi:hypothetical protein
MCSRRCLADRAPAGRDRIIRREERRGERDSNEGDDNEESEHRGGPVQQAGERALSRTRFARQNIDRQGCQRQLRILGLTAK